jgi:cyclopropane fatty-acyl-phospholipid synthase-like methyltransferase
MSSRTATKYNKNHYDSVTDAWGLILGDSFHYGYFKSGDMDLKSATDCLIDLLAGMDTIDEKSKILDVGCGTGRPAFYLHEKYNCQITGISTSKKGVAVAKVIAKEKKSNSMVNLRSGMPWTTDSSRKVLLWCGRWNLLI